MTSNYSGFRRMSMQIRWFILLMINVEVYFIKYGGLARSLPWDNGRMTGNHRFLANAGWPSSHLAMPRWRRVCTAVSPLGSAIFAPKRPPRRITPGAVCASAGLPAAQRGHCGHTVTHTFLPQTCGLVQGVMIQSANLKRRRTLPGLMAVLPREAGAGRENRVVHRQRHSAQNVAYDGTHPRFQQCITELSRRAFTWR
jgi:hypothetical protein